MAKRRTAKKKKEDLVEKLADASKLRDSLDVFLERTYDEFGGIEQIAAAMHDVYQTSRPGSTTRVQILNTILKFMSWQQERAGPVDDELDFLTQVQMKAVLRDILGVEEMPAIAELTGKEVTNGEVPADEQ